jgi:hypothetical protein
LDRRQIDRHPDLVGPVGGFLERGSEHPLADSGDQAAFLGKRNELVGRDRAAGRMGPADKRLEPANFLAGGADDRLVGDPQLAALDRLPKIVFEHLAVGQVAVHRRFVETMLASARRLGRIQGEIGVADQAVGARAPRIADRNPDRRADRHLVALDRVRPRDLLDEGPGERLEKTDVHRAGKHRLELIAAQSADLAMVAHHRFQPLGDLAQQSVADRVAKRVVDILEPVEVDEEQRTAFLSARRVAKRFVERLPHQRAVGQASQRVEPREARNLLFGAALLGEVGADPAESEEAATLVEHRVPRQ